MFKIVLFFTVLLNESLFAQFTIIPNPLGSQNAANTRVINSICITNEGLLVVATSRNEKSDFDKTSPVGLYTYYNGQWKPFKFGKRSDSFEEYFNLTISPDGKKIAANHEVITTDAYRKIILLEVSNKSILKETGSKFENIGISSYIKFDPSSILWSSVQAGRMYDNSNITLSKYNGVEWMHITNKNCFTRTNFVFTGDNSIITNSGTNYLYEFKEGVSANEQKQITASLKYNTKNVFYKNKAIWFENEYEKSITKIIDNEAINFKLPEEIEKVNCILVNNTGTLFVGTNIGLVVFKNENITTYSTQTSNLPGNNIRAITEDSNGKIWIAGYDEKSESSFVCTLIN